MNNVVGFTEKQERDMWLEVCLMLFISQNTYMLAALHVHSKCTVNR